MLKLVHSGHARLALGHHWHLCLLLPSWEGSGQLLLDLLVETHLEGMVLSANTMMYLHV